MHSPSMFQTERIVLRPFEPDDLLALQSYLNHPGLEGRRYLPWGFPNETPLSRRQVEEVLGKWEQAEKAIHLAIAPASSPSQDGARLLGHASCEWDWDPISPHLAIVLATEHQRQGYGRETLTLLLDYLFECTPANNASGWVADWNEPALSFAIQQGFREGGRSRREGLRNGTYYDEIMVDLLRAEWMGRTHSLNQAGSLEKGGG